MKILVIGSGGREHALAWKIRQSPLVREVFCAPGNAGIAEVADCVAIESTHIVELADFAQQIAVASGMEYRILKSSDADKRQFRALL